jgi:hypothetical protein
MRCSCTACLLAAELELLRTGRTRMATLLIEQALAAEQDRTKRAKPLAWHGRRARS